MVTITTNVNILAGPEGVIIKGQPKLVSEDYADTLQDGWLLASRSDAADFKDPSALPAEQGSALAKTQWMITSRGKAAAAREAADKAAVEEFNKQVAAQQAANQTGAK